MRDILRLSPSKDPFLLNAILDITLVIVISYCGLYPLSLGLQIFEGTDQTGFDWYLLTFATVVVSLYCLALLRRAIIETVTCINQSRQKRAL